MLTTRSNRVVWEGILADQKTGVGLAERESAPGFTFTS